MGTLVTLYSLYAYYIIIMIDFQVYYFINGYSLAPYLYYPTSIYFETTIVDHFLFISIFYNFNIGFNLYLYNIVYYERV